MTSHIEETAAQYLAAPQPGVEPTFATYKQRLDAARLAAVMDALLAANGSSFKAARLLRITPRMIQYTLRALPDDVRAALQHKVQSTKHKAR